MKILTRRRRRFGGPDRPFPSSTTELTPDDWTVIRRALERAEHHLHLEGSYTAADRANEVRVKIDKEGRLR